MAEINIDVYSHNVVAKPSTAQARGVLTEFSRRLILYGLEKRGNRFVRVPSKVFAAARNDRSEFRFHINHFKDLKEFLDVHMYTGDKVQVTQQPIPEYDEVEIKIKEGWSDRPHQPPLIEYASQKNEFPSKLVLLQTGKGKSYVTMRVIENIRCRAVYIIRPMYIDKWLVDFYKTYDIEPENIMVIQGGKDLQKLIQLALIPGGLDGNKIIVISNTTYRNYIKLYEKFGDDISELGYGCPPQKLFETLRAGSRVIDEVHQDFHLNFKADLYTNVSHSLSLSATFRSDDDFINRMYEIAYPPAQRCQTPAYEKYAKGRAIFYNLYDPTKVRCLDWGSNRYSHILFEQSILRNPVMLKNYFGLLKDVIHDTYIQHYVKGNKLLVFAASVEMCTKMTEYLVKEFPQYSVKRYVDDDPYEDLLEPDIRCATMIKAGTAVDIDKLHTTIMTTAINSRQSNEQGLGRLREMKDGQTPIFCWFVCEDIPKQVEYHTKKKELMENKLTSIKDVFYGKRV